MRGFGTAVAALCAVLATMGVTVSGDTPPVPGGCSTALLVVDVQNAYVDVLDLTTIDGVHLVPQLAAVLEAARAAGLPIVYIQHRDPNYPEGDAQLDTVAALAPLEGDPIVWKTHGSAFWDTRLADVLAALGASRILITGLATTGCVNATAQGALPLGYDTWVVADAHAGGGIDSVEYYNTAWPELGIAVRNSEDIDFASFGCPFSPSP